MFDNTIFSTRTIDKQLPNVLNDISKQQEIIPNKHTLVSLYQEDELINQYELEERNPGDKLNKNTKVKCVSRTNINVY